jgi:hypothetical protein
MRGFQVPTKPEDYWECARIVMGTEREVSSNLLEWLLLGPDRNVQLHLLIPTQFGILLNEMRAKKIVSVIKEHPDKSSILLRQQECIMHCCKCQKSLEQMEDKPYQVVIRIASGETLVDESVWNYDFLLCFLCFDCQTAKTCALLKTSEVVYESLAECFLKYGFSEPFSSENLMDAYLERFILLNQQTPLILEEVMQVSRYCHHCGKQTKRLVECVLCKIVYFCSRGDCLKKAHANHHEKHLCLALREQNLFHIESALYVNLIGVGEESKRILLCNRYAKI